MDSQRAITPAEDDAEDYSAVYILLHTWFYWEVERCFFVLLQVEHTRTACRIPAAGSRQKKVMAWCAGAPTFKYGVLIGHPPPTGAPLMGYRPITSHFFSCMAKARYGPLCHAAHHHHHTTTRWRLEGVPNRADARLYGAGGGQASGQHSSPLYTAPTAIGRADDGGR